MNNEPFFMSFIFVWISLAVITSRLLRIRLYPTRAASAIRNRTHTPRRPSLFFHILYRYMTIFFFFLSSVFSIFVNNTIYISYDRHAVIFEIKKNVGRVQPRSGEKKYHNLKKKWENEKKKKPRAYLVNINTRPFIYCLLRYRYSGYILVVFFFLYILLRYVGIYMYIYIENKKK